MNKLIREFFDGCAEKWDEYSGVDDGLLCEYIKLLNVQSGGKTLDLACGTGVLSAKLVATPAKKIIAVDISQNMINIAKSKILSPRVEFICCDFFDLKEGDFDSVIIYNALPHFAKRKELAVKLAEKIKVGGKLLVCHGTSKEHINNCHKNVMNISSHLHSPTEEFANFSKHFEMISSCDSEKQYYILMKKI